MRKQLGKIQPKLGKPKYITTPDQALEELAKSAKTARQKRSIKVLADHYNMQLDRDKEQHWLFAKLFMAVFNTNYIFYKDGNVALREVNHKLQQPMEAYFDEMNDNINHIEVLTNLPDDVDKATEMILKKHQDMRSELVKKINLALNDINHYA